MKYSVHWALRDDFNEGWVWIRDSELRTRVELSRPIVRIRANRKHAYCEAVWAGSSYYNRYRATMGEVAQADGHLFMSDWYRRRLGVGIGEYDLRIDFPRRGFTSAMWRLRACIQHPQLVVLLATSLGIIGVGLGVMGLGFGALTVQQWAPASQDIGLALVACGAIVVMAGAAPMFARR